MAALYAAIQTAERYFITPMIQRRIIAIPPALILSAQVIMGVVQGNLGILLATPLVAVAIVLTKLIYVEDVLGEQHIRKNQVGKSLILC